MELEKVLTRNRKSITQRWIAMVMGTYPQETATMLKKESNRFANPVGQAIREGLEGLFDELIKGLERERLTPFLDKVIRVRAIQDFSPGDALSFVFFLKDLVRDQLAQERGDRASLPAGELAEFEARIDRLALLAFENYTECREKLYEIRINEIKNRSHRLLQKANLLAELDAPDPTSKDGNT